MIKGKNDKSDNFSYLRFKQQKYFKNGERCKGGGGLGGPGGLRIEFLIKSSVCFRSKHVFIKCIKYKEERKEGGGPLIKKQKTSRLNVK